MPSKAKQRWLNATWPFVRAQLPSAPGRVLEIGCGAEGGFVPALLADGYAAVGVDPLAPEGPAFEQVEFEHFQASGVFDAIVACTSLHHVADLDDVLERIESSLRPGGTLVIVEWANEDFDEATARWCFDRLSAGPEEPGWLHAHLEQWQESGIPWETYAETWARREELHHGKDIARALESRFDTRLLDRGPYFFSEFEDFTKTDEQAAIDDGLIKATCIRYAGAKL